MADKARKRSEGEIIIPLADQIFARLKRDTKTGKAPKIEITITLTIQPETCDGSLHLRGHCSRLRARRMKRGADDAA